MKSAPETKARSKAVSASAGLASSSNRSAAAIQSSVEPVICAGSGSSICAKTYLCFRRLYDARPDATQAAISVGPTACRWHTGAGCDQPALPGPEDGQAVFGAKKREPGLVRAPGDQSVIVAVLPIAPAIIGRRGRRRGRRAVVITIIVAGVIRRGPDRAPRETAH